MKSNRYSIYWRIGLLIVGAISMIPLIYLISMSFRTPETAFDPVIFKWPIVLDNYKTIFAENELYKNFISSMIITVTTVVLVTLFASMAAFGLTRKEVKFKNGIYNLLLITLMVPICSLLIPLTQINSSLNMLNKYQGLILPYTALGIPFALVILKGFMDNFPTEIEEAAKVDGCSNFILFFKIVLPTLRPGIIVVVIWQFLTTWNEFLLALVVMSEKNMKTLTLVPMLYQGQYFSQPGALFAILVIISIPMIVFYILVQKYFVQGLMSGSVKG